MTTAGGGGIDAAFSGPLGAFNLDVAFSAPARGITGLFGPSGCGKTTTLRCVAGLQRLGGHLRVGGAAWQDDAGGTFLKPHRRPVGYVFQEASLFPHLSVRGNLLYGARRAAGEANGGGPDFDGVVGLLGIGHLLDRAPAVLSGGERQRVALGRALLSRPRLLLMDEPLSALDRMTKEDILPYFEALRDTLAIPVLYVSHDIAELERLADRLVLLDRGRVIASGPLAELETDPDLPLQRAPDAAVTLEGRVADYDETYGLTGFAVAGGTLFVPGRRGAIGSRQRLRIQASDVSFVRSRPTDTTILNILPVKIVTITGQDAGKAQVNVVVALGEDGSGPRVVGRITRKSVEALALAPGMVVHAQFKSVALLGSSFSATPPG
ncbi:MAG: molybdenum ABC transporter ATP-binding protein [Bauldia sp.]|nr:molybdenum ABC transporter ATP-binding protein [Bauldia sp.]